MPPFAPLAVIFIPVLPPDSKVNGSETLPAATFKIVANIVSPLRSTCEMIILAALALRVNATFNDCPAVMPSLPR